MKSFSLIKTYPHLTTNAKLVIDGDTMSLSSFGDISEVGQDRYQRYSFNKNSDWTILLSKFWNGTDTEVSFGLPDIDVKYSNDYNQFPDDSYVCGPKRLNTTLWDKDWEYLTSLYIGDTLPEGFIVFRTPNLYWNNWRKESDDWSVVSYWNIKDTNFGKWLNNNFFDDEKPDYPIDINWNESTVFKGVDIENGGWGEKEINLNNELTNELGYAELEMILSNSFKNLNIAHPNIINISYTFNDDIKSKDDTEYWKWGSYIGFYIDNLEAVSKYFINIDFELKSNIKVNENNEIVDLNDDYVYPFLKTFNSNTEYWIEYNGNKWEVKKELLDNDNNEEVLIGKTRIDKKYKWTIIAPESLEGKISDFNKSIISIINNEITFSSLPTIEHDILILKIGDNYEKVYKKNGKWYINSDKLWWTDNIFIKYQLNGDTTTYENPQVSLFGVKFTELRNLDTKLLDNQITHWEYEEESSLPTNTNLAYYHGKTWDIYIWENEEQPIPVSSEYMASDELWQTKNKDLMPWVKPITKWSKWAFYGSLGSNDYPVKFNNNYRSGVNNGQPQITSNPELESRSLDWFYTLDIENDYEWKSLHLDNAIWDTRFYFTQSQYFDDSLSRTTFNGEKRVTQKWSTIIHDDTDQTLFRGAFVKFWNCEKVDIDDNGDISLIDKSSLDEFKNYKFSVIASPLSYNPKNNFSQPQTDMSWKQIDIWQLGKTYQVGDRVRWGMRIWSCISSGSTNNPVDNPANMISWEEVTDTITYSTNSTRDWIWWNEQWWYNAGGSIDIWNPNIKTYQLGDKVIYENKVYEWKLSNSDNNLWGWPTNSRYWKEVQSTDLKWKKIEVWNKQKNYLVNAYVLYKGSVYKYTSLDEAKNKVPNLESDWEFIYKIEPDTTTSYQTNDLMFWNDMLWWCDYSNGVSKLNTGINLYINKKCKSILLHLYSNDGLLYEEERTDMYNVGYNAWTLGAIKNNFNNYINPFFNKRNVYVINEDGTERYSENDNIQDLPYWITIEDATPLNVLKGVKDIKYYNDSNITPKFSLNSNVLNDSNFDFWDRRFSRTEIVKKANPKLIDSDWGLKNEVYNKLLRFPGPHDVITYVIPMFNTTNRKWDLELKDWGKWKERIGLKSPNDILKSENMDYIPQHLLIDEWGGFIQDHDIYTNILDKFYYKFKR